MTKPNNQKNTGEFRAEPWVHTFSGRKVNILDPKPEQICIVDIAHSLSMQCRFNGHCNQFYSVAEHSMAVSRLVAPGEKLAALLHDAAEAYVSDLPSPVKHIPSLGSYSNIENKLLSVIYDKFKIELFREGQISPLRTPTIKEADMHLLKCEALDMFEDTTQLLDWGIYPDMEKGKYPVDSARLPHVRFSYYSPKRAKKLFLALFKDLAARRIAI